MSIKVKGLVDLFEYRPSDNVYTDRKTVTFLDWDDTLMCTTAVTGSYSYQRSFLQHLSVQIMNILYTAKYYGDVYIVTNGTATWVDQSIRDFIPQVRQVIRNMNIPIVSARDLYESRAPTNPTLWKTIVFKHCLSKSQYVNILSIGDSIIDMDALRDASSRMYGVICKRLKLIDRPSIHQLIYQLEMVSQIFDRMYIYGTDIDLVVEDVPDFSLLDTFQPHDDSCAK